MVGYLAPVRALAQEDLPACLALADSLSWAPDEAKWRLLIGLGGGLCADGPDGRLAGTVFVNAVAPGLAAVGMLLVAPDQSRRGLGTHLMVSAMRSAPAETFFLYATPQGRRLYEKLGFRPVDLLIPCTGTYTRPSGPARLSMARPAAAADLPLIAAVDAAAFGADRAALLGRLLAFAGRVAVAEHGYGAAWTEAGLTRVGPLVAGSADVAKSLVDALLDRSGPVARIDLHSDAATRLSGWLYERGLALGKPVPLMVHGPDLPSDRRMLLAPFAQALG